MPIVFRGNPTEDTIAYIAAHMREDDKAEVFAASGQTPLEALREGVRGSSYLACIHGDGGAPLALYGKTPLPQIGEGVSAPWMLGTKGLEKHRAWVFRSFAPFVDECQGRDFFWNLIDARNVLHIRWLQFHGFEFVKRHEEFGHSRLPFWEFIRRVRPD